MERDKGVSINDENLKWTSMPRFLYIHCLKIFVLDNLDAQKRVLVVDEEVAFHASIIHDFCLTAAYPGDSNLTFQESSGRFAVAYARAFGVFVHRTERVYQAILLHAGKVHGRGPDIELVMHGARQDVIEPDITELTDDKMGEIEAKVPRLSFKTEFISVLEDDIERSRNPDWTERFVQTPPLGFQDNRWSS